MYKRFLRASDIKKIDAEWLWEPYIPRGRVTVLHGEEGVGKTMFGIKLMAACTNKVRIDPYYGYLEKCRCLYLTNEEKLSSIIVPKLEEAGAKLENILIVNDRIPFSLEDDSIREMITEEDIELLVIDPISVYLSTDKDIFDASQEVVSLIKRLSQIAQETGCAVVLLEQSEGLESFESMFWKYEFGSDIASILCLSWDDDLDYDERILYHEYSILSLEGDPIVYVLKPGKGMKCDR